MLVREVGKLPQSIEISHLFPNENRSEQLLASAYRFYSRHIHVSCGFGVNLSNTYDRGRKYPPCTMKGSQRLVVFLETSKEQQTRLCSKERKITINDKSCSASIFF